MLVITHYQRLLNYIVPDRVHVLAHGRISRSGGKELALELESRATPSSSRRPHEALTRQGNDDDVLMKTKAEQRHRRRVRARREQLPGGAGFASCRAEAIGAFGAVGLPHRRIEEWKYTDLRDRLREFYPPALPAIAEGRRARQIDAALGPLAGLERTRIVFVDGALQV